MFERFTDRARRVVVLAQEEARLLNHAYIGTEHILLGLIHEGEGVAAKALERFLSRLSGIRSKRSLVRVAHLHRVTFRSRPGRRKFLNCLSVRHYSLATITLAPSTSSSDLFEKAKVSLRKYSSSWVPTFLVCANRSFNC